MDDGGFSGVVRLTNISDFIAPAQNCIIPLSENTRSEEAPLVALKRKTENKGEGAPKKTIKVSLNDCLACNGCITSAETVLVEEQSIDRMLEGMTKCILSVVTVSPQSVCSIAAKRGITVAEAAKLISSYFFSKGVRFVVDSSFARQFALEEGWKEFEEYLQQPNTSSAPLLSSACPGFVCYAEKSHGKLLVPMISKVRSPQAVMGALVKELIAKECSVDVSSVYHATVMPCFDKKLEASRPDFKVSGTEFREVDCVVSTAELDAQLDSVTTIVNCEQPGWLGDFARGHLIGSSGGTSGGYAESIAQRFMHTNPGCQVTTTQPQKNVEVVQLSSDARTIRVARVYGFRNIQNMVRKLKTKKCDYDYVEVMACPSGCGNGGGQIRAETNQEREEILKNVESLYSSIPQSQSDISETVNQWASINPKWNDKLQTEYRSVETNIGTNLAW